MLTTKYGIIWSQNVNFVPTLTAPLMGMGVLYPRMRDFSLIELKHYKVIHTFVHAMQACMLQSSKI